MGLQYCLKKDNAKILDKNDKVVVAKKGNGLNFVNNEIEEANSLS